MKFFRNILAALALVLGLSVAVAPTANAGWPGGSVDYWRYYGGAVPYIMLDCDGVGWRSLSAGQWSKGGVCADVNGFVVFSGSKLFCGERYGLRDYVYYPGYHSIGNFAYRACEMRAHSG